MNTKSLAFVWLIIFFNNISLASEKPKFIKITGDIVINQTRMVPSDIGVEEWKETSFSLIDSYNNNYTLYFRDEGVANKALNLFDIPKYENFYRAKILKVTVKGIICYDPRLITENGKYDHQDKILMVQSIQKSKSGYSVEDMVQKENLEKNLQKLIRLLEELFNDL